MKTLFSIAVLVAVIYLFLPKDALEKLSTFMPKQQIEQAAETVLSDVDQRLEQFKSELLIKQNNRITKLEEQITNLQDKLHTQAEQIKLAVIENKEQALLAKQSTEQTQNVASEIISTETTTEPQLLASASTDIAVEESAKQQAIKRQAYLQDLAERMNRTSLHALTK
jgi:hypothetical protein